MSSKNLEDFTKIVGWVVWHPYLILNWLCVSEFELQFHAPVLKVSFLGKMFLYKTWKFSNRTWKNLENTWNFILTFVWPPCFTILHIIVHITCFFLFIMWVGSIIWVGLFASDYALQKLKWTIRYVFKSYSPFPVTHIFVSNIMIIVFSILLKELVGQLIESVPFKIFIFALIVVNAILIGLQTSEKLVVISNLIKI